MRLINLVLYPAAQVGVWLLHKEIHRILFSKVKVWTALTAHGQEARNLLKMLVCK